MFLNVKMLKSLISALKDNANVNILLNIPGSTNSLFAVVDRIVVSPEDGGKYDDLNVNIYIRESEIKLIAESMAARKEAAK